MTVDEAIGRLEERAQAACDELGNKSRLTWSLLDIEAVHVLTRTHHAGDLIEALERRIRETAS